MHTPASPPATHNRKSNRIPIDALWATPGLLVTRSGYAPFDSAVGMKSDHRLLWMEVDDTSLLSKNLPSSVPVRTNRLSSNDSRLHHWYNSRVKMKYRQAHVDSQSKALASLVQSNSRGVTHLLDRIVKAYNLLHHTTTDICRDVESNLRVLNAGKLPWSPKLQ